MAYCSNCGVKLEENAKFCLACGTKADGAVETVESVEPEIPTPVETIPEPPKASGNLNVGMLVWSIINMVICCTPIAVPALIMTILAKTASYAEEEVKKIKTAKTLNIISTIVGFIGYTAYICFVVVMVLVEYGLF